MRFLKRLFRLGRSTGGDADTLGREFGVGDLIERRFEIETTRRGYMGVVYIAYDRHLKRRVVLKTFQNKYLWDEEAIARFNAEVELWMRLGQHPNIVSAYDLRMLLGKPHVIAEYVHGGTLRTLVGHLSLQETLDYGIQICRGMQYAFQHAAVLHRDLKPDNVMVTLDGQAKVTDFGLARLLPTWQWAEHLRDPNSAAMRMRATITSDELGGTLPYMAPELFEGAGQSGTWTDVYAFGVLLYECMTGKLPFDAIRDESLIRLHVSAPPRDPRTLKPSLPPQLTAIVLRCLAKRPSERYQDFDQVEDALQHVRADLFGSFYTATWPEDDAAESERATERGLAHMQLAEYKEALRAFNQAAGLDRQRADSWLHIARANLSLWQYHEALNAVEEGLRRAVSRNEFGQLYGERGNIYTAMELPDRAMAAYDQGLSYTPNAPALWSDRGSLLRRLGRPQEAQKCFERAIRFDPLDLTARQLLADLHYAEERYRQAQSIYEEIVRLNPRAADAWSRIGICHLHQRRTQDAGDAFTMALRIDPEHAEAAEGQRIVSEMLERR